VSEDSKNTDAKLTSVTRFFTLIMDCDGGTYISQHSANDQVEVVRVWARSPHPDMLSGACFSNFDGEWTREILQDLEDDIAQPVALDSLVAVWFACLRAQKRSFFLNIVETKR
jgi:hypothetical protein